MSSACGTSVTERLETTKKKHDFQRRMLDASAPRGALALAMI
jgi:hypothetical protein